MLKFVDVSRLLIIFYLAFDSNRSQKNDHGLRRTYSEILVPAAEASKIIEELNQNTKSSEVEIVECECCGMSEDCTPTYIGKIKEFFCGKWVCGICSEAVKERMRREPSIDITEALDSHMALCKNFNRTVRINPNLSLATTMRAVAKRILQERSSKDLSANPKIARTVSCSPRLDC